MLLIEDYQKSTTQMVSLQEQQVIIKFYQEKQTLEQKQ